MPRHHRRHHGHGHHSHSHHHAQSSSRSQVSDDFDDMDDTDPVLHIIRSGLSSVKDYINEILPQCPSDKKKQAMGSRVEKLLDRLVKTELVYKEVSGIVQRVADDISENADSDADSILRACEGIEKVTNQKVNEFEANLTESDMRDHPKYTSLKQDLRRVVAEPAATLSKKTWRNKRRVRGEEEAREDKSDEQEEENEDEEDNDNDNNDDDEDGEEQNDDDEEEEEEEEPDLEVQGDEELIPETDPITKAPLTDPIRNKKCRHIYGKAAIMQLMKKNHKLRCPIPGCSNKDFLRAFHLAEEPELTAAVERRQNATPSKKSRRSR